MFVCRAFGAKKCPECHASWRPRPHDGTRRSFAGEAATRRCVCEGDGRGAPVLGSDRCVLSSPGPPPSEAGAATVIGAGGPSLKNVGRSGAARPPQGQAAPKLRMCSGRWSPAVSLCADEAAGPPERVGVSRHANQPFSAMHAVFVDAVAGLRRLVSNQRGRHARAERSGPWTERCRHRPRIASQARPGSAAQTLKILPRACGAARATRRSQAQRDGGVRATTRRSNGRAIRASDHHESEQ
jgi:hypothetical protein